MKKHHKLTKKTIMKNYALFGLLGLSLIILIILLIKTCFYSDGFKVEARTNNINKVNKKLDDDYNTVGWLRVQGTNIDYPVLAHMKEGQVFPVEIEKYVWINTGDNKYHNVVNIMGHNIMNLSSTPIKTNDVFNRFEELMAFVYYDFAKENRYIQLTMDGNDYIYEIFAAGFEKGYNFDTLPIKEYTEDEMQKYLKMIGDSSIYDYDVKTSINDKYITLVTCTRFFGSDMDSFYIAGKQIPKNEIKDYSMKKNNNYKEIEEVLKGDGENDEENA